MSHVSFYSHNATQQQPFHPTNNSYAGLPEGFQNALRAIDTMFEEAIRRGQFTISCSQASRDEDALYNVSDDEQVSDENLPPSDTLRLHAFSMDSPQPLQIDRPGSMLYSPLSSVHHSLMGRVVFMELPVDSPDHFSITPPPLELATHQPMSMRHSLEERQMFETSGCTPALDRWSFDRSLFNPEPVGEPNQTMPQQAPGCQTLPRTSMHSESPDSDSFPTPNAHVQSSPGAPKLAPRRLLLDLIPTALMRPLTPPAEQVHLAVKREGETPQIRTQSLAFNSPAKPKKRAKPVRKF